MIWTRGKFITTCSEPRRTVHGDVYLPCIYFVSANGLTKIGWTTDPFRRMCELAVSTPAPLLLEAYVPGSKMHEHRLHRVFAKHREHGEWFRRNVRLSALVNELRSAADDAASRSVIDKWTNNLPPRRWEIA